VGPTDVGKSSVSKILCNYAVRKGWHPLFVDLDLGQNGIATPATVGAVPVDRPIDPSEGFASARDLPLVYFHGDSSPGNNPDLYGHLIDNLATMIDKRNATNADAKASGSVVNTMGWVDGAGYKLLLRALDALKITDVLVVGQERLHAELRRDFRGKTVSGTNHPIEVWKLPKSGGVVERSPAFRRATRDAAVKAYFYGPEGDLAPSSTTVDFGKVSVFKIGSGPRAPSSALPIGQKTSADPLRVSTVAPSMGLLNAVLAVSHGTTQREILNQNVAGFVYVTEVDMASGRFTYTAPAGGALPSRNLILGTLKWIET
jgi:polyribonucleotide 5'-hydroxyl-kinase